MKIVLNVTLVLIVFAFSGFAADEQAAALDFSLPGSDGNAHSLADYADAKAVVVMFIATRCPISNGFNKRMVEVAEIYQPKGFVFLGINSNKLEKMDEVKEHAKEHGFPFVVLKDEQNVVADLYKAKVTPEVYVLDSQKNVLYHGRIDDSASASERKSEDLLQALDDILAGQQVKNSETKAFGCTIKRVSM
ncbi:thioredoxin family protein [candidate division KSB1 bacterium]|nr:thioredoxin family protein [candidate division KSB1 bacterium]